MPKIRVKEWDAEEIGMGFNSQIGKVVGTALEGFEIKEFPLVSGAQLLSFTNIINSHEELLNRLGLSFEKQGRYGFLSTSRKAGFAESLNYNSMSTFFVAGSIVPLSFIRGSNYRVKANAQALLDSHRLDEFKSVFGDSFVRGLQTGGEFYAVIKITSISIAKQAELAATLQAEFNGLVAGGSFKAQFEAANKSASSKSDFSIMVFQRGGGLPPLVDINGVINRYKQFPEIARTSPAALETEIATYDTIPLPVSPIEEQEDTLFVLRDAWDKKLNYLQKKNDLEFALNNQMFFKDLPPADVLRNAIGIYKRLIDAVMEHGVKLSRGEIKTPALFTPPINEPAPILLKRVSPRAEDRLNHTDCPYQHYPYRYYLYQHYPYQHYPYRYYLYQHYLYQYSLY